MRLLGPLHLAIVAIIVAIAAALVLLCRKNVLALNPLRRSLGAALAINELIWWIWRYSQEGVHAGNLPLQLCDVAVWLGVLASFTNAPAILQTAYFIGISGAAMALLTPDLTAPWPSYPDVYFFLAHGGIVICVAVAIFGARRKFSRMAVWRSFALLLAYAAIVGAIDWRSGADYMFLLSKPTAPSLLDRMGPWPWYIAGAAAVALALFWILWLPVRESRQPEPDERASARGGRAPSVDAPPR